MKKLVIPALAIACLALVACDGSTPSKKPVQVRPVDPKNQVTPGSSAFKGGDSLKSSDKVGTDGKPASGGN